MDVARRAAWPPVRVSLADLLRTRIEPTAGDAVAIIVQLAQSPQNGPADPGTAGRQPRLAACRWNGDAVARAAAALAGGGSAAGEPAGPRRHGLRDAAGSGDIVESAALQKGRFTIPSLSAFAAALAPFQPPDPAAAVRRAGDQTGRRAHRGVQPRLRAHPGAGAAAARARSRARCRPRSRTCCLNPNPCRHRCRTCCRTPADLRTGEPSRRGHA